jgi:cell division protein FtsQ
VGFGIVFLMGNSSTAKHKIFSALKLILGILIVPIAATGAFYFMEKQGIFNVDSIEIVIENAGDQSTYLKPLVKNLDEAFEAHRGISLWKIEMRKLNEQVSNLNWVKDVTISRRWPSKIKVSVVAKEIRLLMMTKNGTYAPIENGGELLPAVELRQIPDVAILQGENFEHKPELRKKAVRILNEIPREGAFSQKTISEIHFDDKDGFWMTLIKDGIRVKLGHDQIATKSVRVGQVLEYVDSRKMDARVIDANLSKKVLVKLRKGP